MPDGSFELTISRKRMLTPQICELELRAPDGGALPSFDAGAHINVRTPDGMVRSYSLSNNPGEGDRYVIAVKREPDGRGGSRSMVDHASEGDRLVVSPPSNAFPLVDASKYLLIAGGIGITPVLSMARCLADRGGANFRLIYCTRSAEDAAYMEELAAPAFAGHVTFHHDGGDPDR